LWRWCGDRTFAHSEYDIVKTINGGLVGKLENHEYSRHGDNSPGAEVRIEPAIDSMNRKQRRAMGRRGAQPRNRSAGSATSTETLAKLCSVAAAYHRAGEFIEAERHYRHILSLSPPTPKSIAGLVPPLWRKARPTKPFRILGK
jgi:hypothetical protein